MQHQSMDVKTLVEHIDSGKIRLPEIQRSYVWKGPQVASLLDSLYRRYPSGSLLLWQTDDEVAERDAAIKATSPTPGAWKALYLLDGQQRVTSLHRVLTGHESTVVVFNVSQEKFQLQSKTTTADSGWVNVHEVLSGKANLFDLAGQLAPKTGLSNEEVHNRIDRVRRINDYPYQIEVVQGLSYEEITDIFVRVNSKGRPLKQADLALATLSARWSGAVGRIETLAEDLAKRNFPSLDSQFLVRALAALTTEGGGFGGLTKAPLSDIDKAWELLVAGLDHTLAMLKSNAGISASKLLASNTALIPVVTHLGLSKGTKLTSDDANGLIYWLLAVGIGLRYSAGKETRLSEDLAAIRGDEPVRALLARSGLLRQAVRVSPEDLEGRTVTSPYFALSYLAARAEGATDWFHGVALGTSGKGPFALEYHHIHPRKTLAGTYSRHQVNDLANFAFISKKANGKISSRSPAKYFPDLDESELTSHFVPTDLDLRTADRYLDFLTARRSLLADAITDWIAGFKPTYVRDTDAPPRPPGIRVDFQIYGAGEDDAEGDGDILLIVVRRGQDQGWTVIPMKYLTQALMDADNGLVPTLGSGEAATDLSDPEVADQIRLPVGPLQIVGTTAEWRQVLDREAADVQNFDDLLKAVGGIPTITNPDGAEIEFFVLETD